MVSVIIVYAVMLICVIAASEIRVNRYKKRLRTSHDTFLAEERKLKQKFDDLHGKIKRIKERLANRG
ncbi:MAG: hypothetical protein K9M99_02880 [Candidatus Cloacimonetes bacterium]|nr:hypothetical protein [Candidatus Cloacimonadota bacterium]